MGLFDPLGSEPLGAWLSESGPADRPAGVGEWRFEYASRGDRVPGRLLVPDGRPPPHPLVLLAHGAGGSKHAPYVEAAALPWVRGGAAVAAIDLPLHGERKSGKLSERFLDGLGFEAKPVSGGLRAALWSEAARQAVSDFRRGLDALAEVPFLDPERVAFAGFSLGSILGACFCGSDPRPRGAALALAGGGFGPDEVDPVHWIARFSPRPCLFVAAERDERIPRAATQAVYEAAAMPKEIVWFECGHADLPGVALKAMWTFLRETLSLPAR